MTPYLDTYLENFVPEVRANLIRKTLAKLLEIDRDEVLEMIDVVLAVSGDLDALEITLRIESTILNVYDDVIGDYGIGFDALDLNCVYAILDVLLHVEDIDDLESILSIIDDEGSPEEKFAEIVANLTDQDEMFVLENVSHVSPSLLDRMSILLNAALDVREESEEHVVKAHDKPTHLEAFLKKHPSAKLNTLLDDGWRLGFPLDTYLDVVLDDEKQTYKSIALNYMACALASGLDPAKAYEVASKHLEKRYEDTHFLHQIIDHVSTYLNGDFNESA